MLGAQCCENPPTPSSSSGEGSVVEIGGLKAYVAGSSDSKRAILLISDIFGYEAPNLRKLADKVAAAGFYVVVPDYFYGDPYPPGNHTQLESVMEWLKYHGTDKGFEDTKTIISALRSKGVSTIGAAGFCWGGKVVADLAKSIDNIQAGVLLHPAFLTVDDIKEVKAPISVLAAETDHVTPPEIIRQFEEVLSTKSDINSFVKIFPGVAHGWTTRYQVDDEKAVKSAEEAHKNMSDWFTEYVK